MPIAYEPRRDVHLTAHLAAPGCFVFFRDGPGPGADTA